MSTVTAPSSHAAMAALFKKPAPAFFPMPNTGTILDISAGSWVEGHRGQSICNGGLSLFSMIAALPNMFKSAVAAGIAGVTLRAYRDSVFHPHDTETTMVAERVERLTRLSAWCPLAGVRRYENLLSEGRMFFSSSVAYTGTELFDLVKKFAKHRLEKEPKQAFEMLDPNTGKPYMYWPPMIEFWDSLSGLKTDNAVEMLAENDVGTADLNMLAMRMNSGKSQIVEQAPDMTARHGIYLLCTGQVGQAYTLDPKKPGVKTLKFLNGEVKLKRVPENTSFQTGNCYVISHYSKMMREGKAIYPYEQGRDEEQVDLIELKLTNMRGKFGISGVPLTIIVSQKDGWLPYLSNFSYLKEDADKYGFIGNDRQYAMALKPDVTLMRTTVRQKLRESWSLQRAVQTQMEMHWMFTHWTEFEEELKCEPTQLYEEIKALGYDWELLLNTRFWHSTVEEGKDIPYLSTYDLLKMRVGRYHPYWYPKTRKEMGLPDVKKTGEVPSK